MVQYLACWEYQITYQLIIRNAYIIACAFCVYPVVAVVNKLLVLFVVWSVRVPFNYDQLLPYNICHAS